MEYNHRLEKPNEANMVKISGVLNEFDITDIEILSISFYEFMKNNGFNPISMDNQVNNELNFYNNQLNFYNHNIYLEFENNKECWDCYDFIKNKTKMVCNHLEFLVFDDYDISDMYQRLPACFSCFQREATHCNKRYCKACAKNQKAFSEVFYEISQDIFINVIMKYINVGDICSLQQSCKGMNCYLNDNVIWKSYLSENMSQGYDVAFTTYLFPKDCTKTTFKSIFMNLQNISMKRLRTKSAVIIQKYWRRIIGKRKNYLIIRDILTKFTDYYNREDYTRSIEETMRNGIDSKTKKKFDKYNSEFKYRDALKFVKEPIFD